MIIKNVIIGILLVAGALGALFIARKSHSPEEKAGHITLKMVRSLGLTNGQREQVYAINLARIQGHMNAYQAGRDKPLLENTVSQWQNGLKAVLTSEQANTLGI